MTQSKNMDENRPNGLKPLQVVSFWDGRPGHEKQTGGVLAALAKLTVVEEVRRTVPSLSRTAQVLQRLSYVAARMPGYGHKKEEDMVDLIIGTGSATHIPMLLLKNACARARAVTCMTPDFLLRGRMDLCFVPRHDRPKQQDNIFVTIGPPNTAAYTAEHDRCKGLMLVGGLDPKSHDWNCETLLDQVKTVLQREPDCGWIMASSPRTPAETLHKLEELAARIRGVEFFSSQRTPPGWIEQQYRQNFTAWVTADSMSMVYEAITAGCRVGILPVKWRQKDNKFQQSLDFLVANNYVTSYEKWLSAGYVDATGVRLDEAHRCARELLRRWWPDRLR